MGSFIDLTGMSFGRIYVIERNGYDKSGKILWKCKCSCGEIKNIRGNDLRSGKVLSCGCLGKEKRQISNQNKNFTKVSYRENLKGKKFEKLTVIEFDEDTTLQKKIKAGKSMGSWWICKCDCGNVVSIQGVSLKNGHTKSCGCINLEKKQEHMRKIQKENSQKRLIDLSGQKFGKLTVIKRHLNNNSQNKPMWVCECECGNIHIVSGSSLKKGDVLSCGCLGRSKGETIIKDILLKNNISFSQEVIFNDLKDKNFLRFDFALLDKNGKIIKLIEFDGRQHFDKNSVWYSETNVKHDKMKNEYCKNKNIPLLRIPYTDLENINLEMLTKI